MIKKILFLCITSTIQLIFSLEYRPQNPPPYEAHSEYLLEHNPIAEGVFHTRLLQNFSTTELQSQNTPRQPFKGMFFDENNNKFTTLTGNTLIQINALKKRTFFTSAENDLKSLTDYTKIEGLLLTKENGIAQLLYNQTTNEYRGSYYTLDQSTISQALFSNEKKQYFTSSTNGKVSLWDLRRNAIEKRTFITHTSPHQSPISPLISFNHEYKLLLIRAGLYTIQAFDERTKKPVKTFTSITPITALSNQGNDVSYAHASPLASENSYEIIWIDHRNNTEMGSVNIEDCPTHLSINPCINYYLLTGTDNGKVYLYNILNQSIATLNHHNGPITSVAWSPFGHPLTTSSHESKGGQAMIWQANLTYELRDGNTYTPFPEEEPLPLYSEEDPFMNHNYTTLLLNPEHHETAHPSRYGSFEDLPSLTPDQARLP